MTRWRIARGQAGYTIAEMLVVAAVLGLVMSGLLSLLVSGSQSWTAGSNRAEAQQSSRLVLTLMVEEIRVAGWDPKAVSNFPAIQALPPGQTGFIISNDWSANGTIETVAPVLVGPPVLVSAVNRGEQITYDFVGGALRRRETPIDGAPVAVTTALASITFTYRDADDVVVLDPHLPLNAMTIRTVEINAVTMADQGGASATNARISSTSRARVRNRS